MKRPEMPAALRRFVRRRTGDVTVTLAADPVEQLKGEDRIGVTGRILTMAGGAVGGGVVGAVLGTAAIPVLTTGAQLVGITLVASSPLGWVAGGVALGGLGAYALGRAVHSGGKSDQIRADFLRRYSAVRAGVAARKESKPLDADLDALIVTAVAKGALSEAMAARMRAVVTSGTMSREVAILRLSELVSGEGR